MMRTPLSQLACIEARSLTHALDALAEPTGKPLTPLAGGTDLYVTLAAGTEKARRFLDLHRLTALRRIAQRDSVLSIGALATYTEIATSPLVRRRVPMLVAAALEVGGIQIQNRGTLGGNVGNGSPAGDTLPVLAVAQAEVVLRSLRGERRVPFAAYYRGYKKSVRRRDELIVAIEIPQIVGRQWFRKVGTRAAQAISKVVAAGVRDGRDLRFALGAVAPNVVRARAVEAVVAAGGDAAAARAALRRDIEPIDDLRSTASYRSRVAANLLAQFLAG
jgi:xanthine dehydrogenase small subunit